MRKVIGPGRRTTVQLNQSAGFCSSLPEDFSAFWDICKRFSESNSDHLLPAH